jgi:hypothetical protein
VCASATLAEPRATAPPMTAIATAVMKARRRREPHRTRNGFVKRLSVLKNLAPL